MDLIDRRDAIRIVDSIDTWQAGWRGDAIESLKALPTAQPDIIYCGDCKYASPNGVYGCRLERFSAHDESIRLFAGDYCSAAERRTDGQSGKRDYKRDWL